MRRVIRIALAFVLTPAIVAAQTNTSDGVHAFLRGDYESAVRILKPLAEGVSQPDPIAQFFLASMYDSGRGVVPNRPRACSLYAAASSSPGPLTQQASVIAQTIAEPWAGTPAAAVMCPPTNTLPWGEVSPASFTLGPGHSVRLDATSTTIEFEGHEHRTAASRSGPAIVYLPIRYTPLDVSSPTPMRRHFVQSFNWHRNLLTDPKTWSLGWQLDEVVGAEIVMIARDPQLITVTASQPPPTTDTSRLVDVRVNATGEAEWALKDPANPRGGVIPMGGAR